MHWEETDFINPGQFTVVRLELHCGALILGSVAHSLLTATDDDSWASLDQVAEHSSQAARERCTHAAISLQRDLVTNTLVFRDHNHALTSSDLAGQTIAQASAWLRSKSLEPMGTETTIAQREYADLPACTPLAGGIFALVVAETG